jgi:hypothetical protein
VERRKACASRWTRAARKRGGYATASYGVPPPFSFFRFFVARMQRSEIRGDIEAFRSSPDFAPLHPGYCSDPIVMAPASTAGII